MADRIITFTLRTHELGGTCVSELLLGDEVILRAGGSRHYDTTEAAVIEDFGTRLRALLNDPEQERLDRIITELIPE